MSVKLMGQAFYFDDLTPTQKLFLLAIADHANDDGFGAYPGQERLARKVSVSIRHVKRLTHEMENKGLIEIVERGNGPGKPNRYYLPWAETGDKGDTQVQSRGRPGHPNHHRAINSEESVSEETSSSSSREDEDEDSYMDRLPAFYKQVHSSPLFLSAVKAPGPYFKKLRAAGDVPPIADLTACWKVGLALADALNSGLQAQGRPVQPLTVPGPTLLPGLALCWAPLERYNLQPRWIRLALGIFCEGDGRIQRVEAAEILERIAKRSDLFAEALRQQSEKLG